MKKTLTIVYTTREEPVVIYDNGNRRLAYFNTLRDAKEAAMILRQQITAGHFKEVRINSV